MEGKITASEAAEFLGISLPGLHKKLKEKDLGYKKSMQRIYFGHKTARALFSIPFKHRSIAFQIVKGGTGKTSLVHSVAIRANLYGARVLCIDLDQQGNLTQAFQVNPEETPTIIDILREKTPIEDCICNISDGLDLIPGRIENAILDNEIILGKHSVSHVYKNLLASLKKKYDVILIDCPPALGQSVAAITLAVDEVIAPVTPEKFCLSGLRISNHEITNLENNFNCKIPMRIVVNKHDVRTSLSHEVLSILLNHPVYGPKLCKSYIRSSQEFPNAIAKGQSIFDTLKGTTAKEDIDLLTKEILNIGQSSHSTNEISLGTLEEISI